MHDARIEMRTTLTIDDDVLDAAKELARDRHVSVGEVISDLARKSLTLSVDSLEYKNGVPLLPVRTDGRVVTLEMVNKLRDEMP
jgi:hypothetical protein